MFVFGVLASHRGRLWSGANTHTDINSAKALGNIPARAVIAGVDGLTQPFPFRWSMRGVSRPSLTNNWIQSHRLGDDESIAEIADSDQDDSIHINVYISGV